MSTSGFSGRAKALVEALHDVFVVEERLAIVERALDAERQEAHVAHYDGGRRERIATAILAGLGALGFNETHDGLAREAIQRADALIAEMDKPKT